MPYQSILALTSMQYYAGVFLTYYYNVYRQDITWNKDLIACSMYLQNK